MKYVPIKEYRFASYDGSYEDPNNPKRDMYTITCKNHPTAKYLTKNPYQRNLHWITPCEEAPQQGWPNHGFECPCPFSDLVVVLTDEGMVW